MRKYLLFWTLLIIGVSSNLMQAQVSGTVTDNESGIAISDVSVAVKGTDKQSFTDEDGNYTIDAEIGDVLVVTGENYPTTERVVQTNNENFFLAVGNVLDELVFVGSRGKGRTLLESAVPVDVIDIQDLVESGPQVNLNQILNYVAPSFNSNTQTISDGTDHIDPASLRGLGPDQVLVLINGKRRHSSSLVNVNGTFGRGQVGTDLNAIPTIAIKRIEILRDGAAAQYGSDAIAGVINIVLKDSNDFTLAVTGGANNGRNTNDQTGGWDGESTNVAASIGFDIGDKGGFINFSGDFDYREPNSRMRAFEGTIFNRLNSIEWVALQSGANLSELSATDVAFFAQGVTHFDLATKQAINAAASSNDLATLRSLLSEDATEAELAVRNQSRSDYNMRVGQSGLRSGRFMGNLSLPLDNGAEIYAFGGISRRKGNSAGFYRLPNQSRTFTPLYINGFLPEINSDIEDRSVSMGIKGKLADWDIDLSNTWGENLFLFEVDNSSNASLGSDTPLTFNAGGHSFEQNTINLDLRKSYESILGGLNVAFGAEYRNEIYSLIAGQEESFALYDANGDVVTAATSGTVDFLGRPRPAGAQVFPGFRQDVTRSRNNVGAYLDLELDATDKWLISSALRFENYSDFGSTWNWKIATLYKVTDEFNLRAGMNTGFRAPSLHQQSFSTVSTAFREGIPAERLIASNNSQIARALGIPELKEEVSYSISGGFTAKVKSLNLSLSADGYFIAIDDRVILTDLFNGNGNAAVAQILAQSNAESVAFFANAIDTETYGVDVVASHSANLGSLKLNNEFALTYSKTEQVDEVNGSQLLVNSGQIDNFFSEESRVYLEESVPRFKARMANTIQYNKWKAFIGNTYFGEVTEAINDASFQQEFSGKIVTDVSLGYELAKGLDFLVGSNNVFDVYPDRINTDNPNYSSGRFPYSRRAPQIGVGGRFLYARIVLNLK